MEEFYDWLIIDNNIKEYKTTWEVLASHYFFVSMLFQNKGDKLKRICQIGLDNNIIVPNENYQELINLRKNITLPR